MATLLARAMVTQYGMSDKLGPLAYGDNEEEVFLGHSIARTQNLSDETQTIVDEEIHRLVDEGFESARKIIQEHLDDLHIIARGLLEYETLSGDEIKDLLAGKPPVREFETEVTHAAARPPPFRPPAAARRRRPSRIPAAWSRSRRPEADGFIELMPESSLGIAVLRVADTARCPHCVLKPPWHDAKLYLSPLGCSMARRPRLLSLTGWRCLWPAARSLSPRPS